MARYNLNKARMVSRANQSAEQRFEMAMAVQRALDRFEGQVKQRSMDLRKPAFPHIRLEQLHERISKVHGFLAYCQPCPTRRRHPLHINQLEELTGIKFRTMQGKFCHFSNQYAELSDVLDGQDVPSALIIICASFCAVERISIPQLRRMVLLRDRDWSRQCWQEGSVDAVLRKAFGNCGESVGVPKVRSRRKAKAKC